MHLEIELSFLAAITSMQLMFSSLVQAYSSSNFCAAEQLSYFCCSESHASPFYQFFRQKRNPVRFHNSSLKSWKRDTVMAHHPWISRHFVCGPGNSFFSFLVDLSSTLYCWAGPLRLLFGVVYVSNSYQFEKHNVISLSHSHCPLSILIALLIQHLQTNHPIYLLFLCALMQFSSETSLLFS